MANKKTTIKKMSQGYGYKYTDLSAIHEELEKQGIEYWQETRWDEHAGADYIYTHLKYDGGDWEPERRGVKVIDTAGVKMNAAQAQGSGVTYARRYSLLMALGWATEDDDGATSGGQQKTSANTGGGKPWDKYKSTSGPTPKQIGVINGLLKKGGADDKAIATYLAKVTNVTAASRAIEELQARLGELQDEEPAPMPSDEELAQVGGEE